MVQCKWGRVQWGLGVQWGLRLAEARGRDGQTGDGDVNGMNAVSLSAPALNAALALSHNYHHHHHIIIIIIIIIIITIY